MEFEVYHLNELKSESGSYKLESFDFEDTYILKKEFINSDEYYYLLRIQGEPKFAMLCRNEGDLDEAKRRAIKYLTKK